MTDADAVRQYVDIYNSGDSAGLGAFYAEDVVLKDPLSPEPAKGREAVLATGAAFRRAFPDMVWTLIQDPVVADGAIAWEVHAEGTMTGPMPGPDGDIPPTGKAFAVDMGIFWTLGPDGLITEEHAHLDATGMMTQLGLVP
jgi:steroid delta-isomerase-like uncharacterized protein